MQVHAGRSSDSASFTSRDRIRQLEDNVSSLWAAVGELRGEASHDSVETAPQSNGSQSGMQTADSGSEMGDVSPSNPPSHLQQLFDNSFVDSRGNDDASPDIGSDKASSAFTVRARRRLQALMPTKNDVREISKLTGTWMFMYSSLFPAVSMPTSGSEMLSKYDALQHPDAHPVSIASLLLSVALTLQQQSNKASSPDNVTGITDSSVFIRQVSDCVEEVLVNNDMLAGTFEGIEVTLLFVRLYVRTTLKLTTVV